MGLPFMKRLQRDRLKKKKKKDLVWDMLSLRHRWLTMIGDLLTNVEIPYQR